MKELAYGGFLPLELNPGIERFAFWEKDLQRFNTVKAALDSVIRHLNCPLIRVPYYYCPSTLEAIRRTGAEVRLYHIDDELMPVDLPDEAGSAIMLVNFFGVMEDRIAELARRFEKATVIVDNAHAFFADPLSPETTFNVYSAKKFFGVPDGAYLIGPQHKDDELPPACGADYAGFLLTSYEQGTNAAYQEKKRVDDLLSASYGGMSALACGLLKNVDYDRVRKARAENFAVMKETFAAINALALPADCPAYLFPLYLPGRGEALKKSLIGEKIYAPTLWNGPDLLSNGTSFELSLAKDTVFLPIDQRYERQDMSHIINRVKEYLK